MEIGVFIQHQLSLWFSAATLFSFPAANHHFYQKYWFYVSFKWFSLKRCEFVIASRNHYENRHFGPAVVPWRFCSKDSPKMLHQPSPFLSWKIVNKAILNVVEGLDRRIRCGERRQQRQMPSLDEEAREFEQRDWTSIFSIAFLFWLMNQIHMELYHNVFLRCLCCPLHHLCRCCSCFSYGYYQVWRKKKLQSQAEAVHKNICDVARACGQDPGQFGSMSSFSVDDVKSFLKDLESDGIRLDTASASCAFVNYWSDKSQEEQSWGSIDRA